jgi:hypothetical protein
VLLLVLPYWNPICGIEQYVCGHQHRIEEQPGIWSDGAFFPLDMTA